MFYLIEHPNPNARERSDGRYHGYPSRQRPVDTIVIHTAESNPMWDVKDRGAQNVAEYAARMTRPASYHTVVDSRERIDLLPTGHTAFHASSWNSRSVGLSLATRADSWPKAPEGWTDRILAQAADVVAEWCEQFNVEPVHATKGVLYAGGSGIIGHGELDPGRRYDPGDAFPWDRFIEMVRSRLKPAPPAPSPLFDSGPVCFIDYTHAPNGGEWWLIADGGVANMGGAPYYGHLLDPSTRRILAGALGVDDSELGYAGAPYSIEPNDLGGYRIHTDSAHYYDFHPGTV